MRAAIIRAHGGLDAINIESVDDPKRAPGEVLVRVKALALNHMDLWARKGLPGFKFPLPLIPGCDMAGVVVEGEGVTPGTEVIIAPGYSCGRCEVCNSGRDNLCKRYGIFGEHRNGGCAELVVVPRENLVPKPARLSWAEAAAYPLTFLTAWHMLVARANIRPGQTVLIHAAGSGVSSAALQIARLHGAQIFATAGGADKCARALSMGAEAAYDTRTDVDWSKAVFEATGKVGVDVVIDHVGKAFFEGSIRALRPGGSFVTCGATSGSDVSVELRRVFFKNLSILGSTMGSRGELFELTRLVADGRLEPMVDRTFPLEAIREAHAALEGRDVFGKIVVLMDPD